MKFSLTETLKGVAIGAFNSVFLQEEVEKMAKERLAICRKCAFNSEIARANGMYLVRKDEHCLKCGCNLHLKTRVPSARCPLVVPLWTSLASDKESEEIMKLLEKNSKDEQTKE